MNYLRHFVGRCQAIVDRYPPRAKRLAAQAQYQAEQDERLKFVKGQVGYILDLLDEAGGKHPEIELAAGRCIRSYVAAAECIGSPVDRFWLERYPNLSPKWY